MFTKENWKTIREASADVMLLDAILNKVAVGTTATYEEITKCVGRSKESSRGIISAAMRRQLNKGRVWEAVRGLGYKLCDDSTIVTVAKGGLRSIHRKASKSMKKLKCATYDKLTPDEKVSHNTSASIYAIMSHVTHGSNIKKLSENVKVAQAQLPTAKTLELFAK